MSLIDNDLAEFRRLTAEALREHLAGRLSRKAYLGAMITIRASHGMQNDPELLAQFEAASDELLKEVVA